MAFSPIVVGEPRTIPRFQDNTIANYLNYTVISLIKFTLPQLNSEFFYPSKAHGPTFEPVTHHF